MYLVSHVFSHSFTYNKACFSCILQHKHPDDDESRLLVSSKMSNLLPVTLSVTFPQRSNWVSSPNGSRTAFSLGRDFARPPRQNHPSEVKANYKNKR